VAKSPYLYDGDVWVTYCDEQLIIEITDYVKKTLAVFSHGNTLLI
jgi:hypothetical protein